LPFQFGDNYTDAYAGTGWMIGLTNPAYIDDGDFSFDVQGVGKLRLPVGYFDSVFRVYYEEEWSLKSDLGLGSPTTILSLSEFGYEYWKAGVTKPILTYYNTTIDDMMGGHDVEEAVRYQKRLTPDGPNSGIAAQDITSKLAVYPNPAGDMVSILLSDQNISKIEWIDMVGKTVFVSEVDAQGIKMDVSSFERGVYFIRITGNHGEVCVQKLVLQ